MYPDYGFAVRQCTRAKRPSFHEGAGVIRFLDLPCFEEVGLAAGEQRLIAEMEGGGKSMFLPIHAESRRRADERELPQPVRSAKRMDYRILALQDIFRSSRERASPDADSARRFCPEGPFPARFDGTGKGQADAAVRGACARGIDLL